MNAQNKNHTRHVESAPLTPVGGAQPLPITGAPDVPIPQDQVKPGRSRSVKVRKVQVTAAPAAASELRASTTYASLGDHVPDKDMLANGLDFASSWSRELIRATLWVAYVRSQTNLAWEFVLRECDGLKSPLLYASDRDGSVATELNAVLKVVDARSNSARLAAVTRNAERKKQQKAKAAQTPPASMVASFTNGRTQ
jgi:hypothetical protein